MKKNNDFKKWIALLVVNLGTSIKLIDTVIDSLKPIFLGAIIAYVLYLPARKAEDWFGKKNKKSFVYKKRRTLSIIITYLVILLLIIAMIKTVVPVISSSANDLIKSIPKNYSEIEKSVIFDNEIGK